MAYDDGLGARVEVGSKWPCTRGHRPAAGAGHRRLDRVAALAEQKAEVKETDLPKDTPTETEEPDRVVTQSESKKPQEDDPKVAGVETSASTESVAQEATARQARKPFRRGRVRSPPRRGSGETVRRLRATWQKELVAHLDKHKRYPTERSRKSAEIVEVVRARPHGSCPLDHHR